MSSPLVPQRVGSVQLGSSCVRQSVHLRFDVESYAKPTMVVRSGFGDLQLRAQPEHSSVRRELLFRPIGFNRHQTVVCLIFLIRLAAAASETALSA